MKVFSPGKIILSGEHSAVYGQPALAMAVDRYAVTTIQPQENQSISLQLPDLQEIREITFSALADFKKCIKEKYQRFLQGDIHIREVLQKPMELVQFAVSLCLHRAELAQGLQINLYSTIPVGCGMGSSAAAILSTTHAVLQHAALDVSKEWIYPLALEAENMQHGRSSGLDLQVSLSGGCCFVYENQLNARPLPKVPFILVNTGTPASSTGECVAKAAPYFQSSQLADAFAFVTNAMDQALMREENPLQMIRENHRLLMQIGVVPERVQRFVSMIERWGGAAKVSGAGAVRGESAGMLLVMVEERSALQKLCEQYGYSILSVQGESRGLHVGI